MTDEIKGTLTGRISSTAPSESNVPKSERPTQLGNGWSGILVLKGTFDVSAIYRHLLEREGRFTLAYGDSQSGVMDFREIDEVTPRTEVLAHVVQKLPIRPFSLMLCGDYPQTMNVPTRNTTVALWNQGQATGGFQRMLESVIQLNRIPQDAKVNYAELVRDRVFGKQLGKFAVCLGYFSRHPRVVLATRNMEIYTWIVHYNDVYAFVWSTDPHYMDRVKEPMDANQQNALFYLPVEMKPRSLLVIHPLFWITKFNKVLNASKTKANTPRLTITSYMRNYLMRMNMDLDSTEQAQEVNNED